MLISLGLDYTHADVETRESFHRGDDDIDVAYGRPTPNGTVREFLAVTTCNRIELYGWTSALGGFDPHHDMAMRWFGDAPEARRFTAVASHRLGRQAIDHLFRVTSGLESQVLGDIHIIGQLRTAYRRATDQDAVGPHLHRLLDTAIRCGKAVKSGTDLMVGRSSVGSEAGTVVLQRVDRPETAKIVVVGAGKIGTHAARSLVKRGCGGVTVLNRTFSRGEALAVSAGCAVARWEDFDAVVNSADAVIVATGASRPVVDAATFAARTGDPILVVDVSMPRNVDPRVRSIDGVALIDLDTLHPQAAAVAISRRRAIPEAEAIVAEHADEFLRWVSHSGAREALRPLRERLLEICLREIEYAAGKHADAERAASRIVSKLMAQPMTVLRERSSNDVATLTGAVRELFSRDSSELTERTR